MQVNQSAVLQSLVCSDLYPDVTTNLRAVDKRSSWMLSGVLYHCGDFIELAYLSVRERHYTVFVFV